MATAAAAAAALYGVLSPCFYPFPAKRRGKELTAALSQLSRAESREHIKRRDGSVGRRLKNRVCFLPISDSDERLHASSAQAAAGLTCTAAVPPIRPQSSARTMRCERSAGLYPGHPHPGLLAPHSACRPTNREVSLTHSVGRANKNDSKRRQQQETKEELSKTEAQSGEDPEFGRVLTRQPSSPHEQPVNGRNKQHQLLPSGARCYSIR